MLARLKRLFGDGLWIGALTFITVVLSLIRRDAARDQARDTRIQELQHASEINARLAASRRDRARGLRPHAGTGWRD
ncbi:MAG: hypothetical protein AAF618_00820 [Pseudomonadota bacterium]